MSVHEKVKMLQEGYYPGLAIPRWSVHVWNLYAQNDQFLYDIICGTHVQCMYMYIHSMNMYM